MQNTPVIVLTSSDEDSLPHFTRDEDGSFEVMPSDDDDEFFASSSKAKGKRKSVSPAKKRVSKKFRAGV